MNPLATLLQERYYLKHVAQELKKKHIDHRFATPSQKLTAKLEVSLEGVSLCYALTDRKTAVVFWVV